MGRLRMALTALTVLTTGAGAAVTAGVLSAPLAGHAAGPPGPVHRAEVGDRAAVTGEVGAHAFPNRARCVYSRGRLSAITFDPVRAAGRQQWEPTGQYVLWSARLQARTRSGPWRKVGGTHYSEAKVKHAGSLETLPRISIPRVFGSPDQTYRVVQSINWYFNNRNKPIVQGQATHVVSRYAESGARTVGCPGANVAVLPPVRRPRHDELDAVRVSFATRNGARARYSVRGTLPRGLRLNARTGVVTGRISAQATHVTATYRRIRSRTFPFTIVARAGGRPTSRTYRWTVFDTAFVMQDYYGRYGCGQDCAGADEPVRNISRLGPKISFGCSDNPQPGIPPERTSVIYRQDYQKENGSLAPSKGRTFRYGDVFKWWYYPCA